MGLREVDDVSDPSERQTGVLGEPTEPFVVSFAVAGRRVEPRRPALASGFEEARRLLERYEAGRDDLQELTGGWVLLRSSVEGVDRTWKWKRSAADGRRLTQALDGFPESFDTVWLNNVVWGGIFLEQGDVARSGRSNIVLRADAKAPASHVDDLAGGLLGLLAAQAAVDGVETGFVDVDSIADPYTKVMVETARLAGDEFAREVHGYYWAVLLTQEHLAALGGLVALRDRSPCAVVEEIVTDHGPAALCRLTESPLDLDAERLLAWRRFLQPVLRPGYPGWQDHVGVRRAPLHRPVWLFEGAPVPDGTSQTLTGGLKSDQPVPAVDYGVVGDPERPICLLYPGDGFDRTVHTELVEAIVGAWAAAGRLGLLYEVAGSIESCSGVGWDTHDDGADVLIWQFDAGDVEVVGALERLASTLSLLEPPPDAHAPGHVVAGLTVT
jgi:hypothetical protein